MKLFEYEKVNSPDEASAKLLDESGETRLIAGGTALVIMLKEGILAPDKLVDVSQIESMRKIEFDQKRGLSIGSMVTHLEIENSSFISRDYPSLREAFHTIGNVRVRSVGTIGGNLAYAEPQCNPPTILSALGATIHVKGPHGERSIPSDEFIKGIFESALEPGEIITSASIPPAKPHSAASFYKFTTKSETDKPTSTVATYIEADPAHKKAIDCRIVVGAVGPKTYRCYKAEGVVKSSDDISKLDIKDIAETASEEFEVMDDLYGPSWYKKHVTQVILRDALNSTVEKIRKGNT